LFALVFSEAASANGALFGQESLRSDPTQHDCSQEFKAAIETSALLAKIEKSVVKDELPFPGAVGTEQLFFGRGVRHFQRLNWRRFILSPACNMSFAIGGSWEVTLR
jgi:hypothetical protein